MTYSPLVDLELPPTSDKQSSRQGRRPNGLIVHHWASTSMAGRDRLVYSKDPASANYLIYDDGRLIGSVPEEYRAWTSSSFEADDDKITVEIQNSTGAPGWKISAAAFATLVALYADLADRYGFAPTRGNIFGHKDFHSTACPGPYLYPRLGDVADQAAALNRAGAPSRDDDGKPAPSKPKPSGAKRKPSYPGTIRPGDRGFPVKLWQRVLVADGYDIGRAGADSVAGADTERATKRWQKDRGLTPDGVVGPKTWGRALLADNDGRLRRGDRGPHVRVLQAIVGVTRDGVFGPDTETATKAVQRHLGVKPDAIPGPDTVGALIKHWS